MIFQLHDCINSFIFNSFPLAPSLSFPTGAVPVIAPSRPHAISFALLFKTPHGTHAKGIYIYTHVVPLLSKIICIYTITRKYLIFYFPSSFFLFSQPGIVVAKALRHPAPPVGGPEIHVHSHGIIKSIVKSQACKGPVIGVVQV